MATLAIQELVADGVVELTLEAAGAEDTLPNASGPMAGNKRLVIVSMDSSPVTVTVTPGGNRALEIGDGSLLVPEPQEITMGTEQPSIFVTGTLSRNRFGEAPVVEASDPSDILLAWVEG